MKALAMIVADWLDRDDVCENRAADEVRARADELGTLLAAGLTQTSTAGGERRAPVNGHPYGTIAWSEHVEAWGAYHRRHPEQDAEAIARRGGFGIGELTAQLGHLPTTWRPNTMTESWWARFR